MPMTTNIKDRFGAENEDCENEKNIKINVVTFFLNKDKCLYGALNPTAPLRP